MSQDPSERIRTVWSEDGMSFWWIGAPEDMEFVMRRARERTKHARRIASVNPAPAVRPS